MVIIGLKREKENPTTSILESFIAWSVECFSYQWPIRVEDIRYALMADCLVFSKDLEGTSTMSRHYRLSPLFSLLSNPLDLISIGGRI